MLTVRELIQKLQNVNQDAEVLFDCSEAGRVFAVEDIYCCENVPVCYILDKEEA